MGNAFRGLGCAGPGEPATDPHSGTRDSLPTLGRYAASAFGASASGASVSRPISRVQCRVCIPLSTLPIVLSVQRVAISTS